MDFKYGCFELRSFRKANGLTQDEVAKYLGVSKAFISQVETGRTALPYPQYLKLDQNKKWDKYKYSYYTGPNSLDDVFEEDAQKTKTENADLHRVRLIPYEARGGMIGDFVDGVHDYDCETVISPIKGVDFAMTVTGDSMAPEYNPGDRILIKKIDPNLFIEWGRVYVLDTLNGAVIKKLEKADDPNFVTCVSINPDVSPFQINVNAVRGWYRVLMVMSMK